MDASLESDAPNVQDAEEASSTPQDDESQPDNSPILSLGGDYPMSSAYTAADWFGQRRKKGQCGIG